MTKRYSDAFYPLFVTYYDKYSYIPKLGCPRPSVNEGKNASF